MMMINVDLSKLTRSVAKVISLITCSMKTNNLHYYTAQKMKFFINDFFSECDQIRRKLRIWSHLLKKSLI